MIEGGLGRRRVKKQRDQEQEGEGRVKENEPWEYKVQKIEKKDG